MDILCLLIGWSTPVKKCHEVPPLGSSPKSPTQTFRRTPLHFSVWKWGIPSTHGHFMSINLENDDRPMDLGDFPWLFSPSDYQIHPDLHDREQTVGPHLLHVETVLQMHHLPQNPHLSLVRRHHLDATEPIFFWKSLRWGLVSRNSSAQSPKTTLSWYSYGIMIWLFYEYDTPR